MESGMNICFSVSAPLPAASPLDDQRRARARSTTTWLTSTQHARYLMSLGNSNPGTSREAVQYRLERKIYRLRQAVGKSSITNQMSGERPSHTELRGLNQRCQLSISVLARHPWIFLPQARNLTVTLAPSGGDRRYRGRFDVCGTPSRN